MKYRPQLNEKITCLIHFVPLNAFIALKPVKGFKGISQTKIQCYDKNSYQIKKASRCFFKTL